MNIKFSEFIITTKEIIINIGGIEYKITDIGLEFQVEKLLPEDSEVSDMCVYPINRNLITID